MKIASPEEINYQEKKKGERLKGNSSAKPEVGKKVQKLYFTVKQQYILLKPGGRVSELITPGKNAEKK